MAYVATYNKKSPKLFTEIMKNLEELKNNDKIKDTAKIIKRQRQLKNLKRKHTSSFFGKNTKAYNNKQCKICNIIVEGKSNSMPLKTWKQNLK